MRSSAYRSCPRCGSHGPRQFQQIDDSDESNLSSRTRSQPLVHPTAVEAAVCRPRAMPLELATSKSTHVARLTGPSTCYEHTAAVPRASFRDPLTDDVFHSFRPQPRMARPMEQFPANRSHSSSSNYQPSLTTRPPSQRASCGALDVPLAPEHAAALSRPYTRTRRPKQVCRRL